MTRRRFLQTAMMTTAAMTVGNPMSNAGNSRAARNVLFLIVDDLRPQLGCYGLDWMATPHIDRLAKNGTLFERASCQFPVCGPSRASLLSGVRPTMSRFRKWNARVDADAPGILTLPQHFRQNGYATQSLGKVFHDSDDCIKSWSGGSWIPEGVLGGALNSYAIDSNRALAKEGKSPPYESAAVEDSVYGDGRIAARAIEELRGYARQQTPFFLAVGFLRPHLPFNAPERYWKLYSRQKLPLARNPDSPRDVPKEALHNWEELRNYHNIPKQGPLDASTTRALIHGYCASTSYLDAQVGAVLHALAELKLRENTTIVFCADHGWQLGEHGLWTKHTLFQTALHTPLIVSGPDIPPGQRVQGLVENLDLYPTLCDLHGLTVPAHVEGKSLRPLLQNPSAPGKEAVFSRNSLGDSIKTDRYRYSEWRNEQGKVTGSTLYDHEIDPDEDHNIAGSSEHRDLVRDLSSRLPRTAS